MGDTKGALDDAEEALNNDSSYVRGQWCSVDLVYDFN